MLAGTAAPYDHHVSRGPRRGPVRRPTKTPCRPSWAGGSSLDGATSGKTNLDTEKGPRPEPPTTLLRLQSADEHAEQQSTTHYSPCCPRASWSSRHSRCVLQSLPIRGRVWRTGSSVQLFPFDRVRVPCVTPPTQWRSSRHQPSGDDATHHPRRPAPQRPLVRTPHSRRRLSWPWTSSSRGKVVMLVHSNSYTIHPCVRYSRTRGTWYVRTIGTILCPYHHHVLIVLEYVLTFACTIHSTIGTIGTIVRTYVRTTRVRTKTT